MVFHFELSRRILERALALHSIESLLICHLIQCQKPYRQGGQARVALRWTTGITQPQIYADTRGSEHENCLPVHLRETAFIRGLLVSIDALPNGRASDTIGRMISLRPQ